MKAITIAKNISDLRRKKGITQEQLAQALNISPQAVSKWETETSLPDTQILPLIADYFDVSVDYLFYGKDCAYADLYHQIFDRVAGYPQQSRESYDEALAVFGYAHHGISRWNIKERTPTFYDEPTHFSNENGLSLFSGRGFGAMVTRDFLAHVDGKTVDFAVKLLPALTEKNELRVCMAILSMSDISFGEMQEKLQLDEGTLRASLDKLIKVGLVIEKESKHRALGLTYEIHDMYHTCLCLLLATLEMQRYSLGGISCCMGFGDYPVKP